MQQLAKILVTGLAITLTQGALADDKEKETLFGGTISTSIKMGTDYVFRGESETNDGEIPMVQGSVTWSHPSGFYLGYFGSTNKFASTPKISAVVGPYIGKSGNIGDTDVNYNVMVFDYQYPGARECDNRTAQTKQPTDHCRQTRDLNRQYLLTGQQQ